SRTTLRVLVVGIEDGSKQTVPTETRRVNRADGSAKGVRRLQGKRLAEAMQDRQIEAVGVRPTAVVTVTDLVEEGIGTKRSSGVVIAADAAVHIGADVLVNALRASVVGFGEPVWREGVLHTKEPCERVRLFDGWIDAADVRGVGEGAPADVLPD